MTVLEKAKLLDYENQISGFRVILTDEVNDIVLMSRRTYHKIKKKEALAALEAEKPADDAVSVVEQWSLEHMGKYESAQTANIDLARHIQQFAESYHAKKCADCKNKRPTYRPFGLDTPSEEQK